MEGNAEQQLMIWKQYIMLMCRPWRRLTEGTVIHDLENVHLHTVNQLLSTCEKFFMRLTRAFSSQGFLVTNQFSNVSGIFSPKYFTFYYIVPITIPNQSISSKCEIKSVNKSLFTVAIFTTEIRSCILTTHWYQDYQLTPNTCIWTTFCGCLINHWSVKLEMWQLKLHELNFPTCMYISVLIFLK